MVKGTDKLAMGRNVSGGWQVGTGGLEVANDIVGKATIISTVIIVQLLFWDFNLGVSPDEESGAGLSVPSPRPSKSSLDN
jgi:hypothetical protein